MANLVQGIFQGLPVNKAPHSPVASTFSPRRAGWDQVLGSNSRPSVCDVGTKTTELLLIIELPFFHVY